MRDASRSTPRQSRDLAQLYLDIVDVIVLSIDRDGKIALANRKACELLGRQEADLIGADWFTVAIPAANGIGTPMAMVMTKTSAMIIGPFIIETPSIIVVTLSSLL